MKDSKVVIITGASSGIGAGTAQHFAQIGYKKLALVARRKEELERVAEQCKRNGAENVLILVKDLMVPEQCQEVIDETVKEFGQIDILISNAGLARQISVRDTKVEDFESIIKLNLTAPFALTKYALPHLEKTKGNIVYNSSVMGQVPGPNLSAYCASKAALDHFVRCVAVEEAPKGIRVNCLSPGLTIQETMVTSAGNKLDEEGYERLHFHTIPLL